MAKKNALSSMRDQIIATIDGEVNSELIDLWLNDAVDELVLKREWNFLRRRATGTVAVADSDGRSLLPLPDDLRKIEDMYILAEGVRNHLQEGRHYEILPNVTNTGRNAVFDNLQNGSELTATILYYQDAQQMLNNSDRSNFPRDLTKLIIWNVLVECYTKLGDLQEMLAVENRYKRFKKEVEEADARAPDLPGQMSPSNHQTREEYETNLNQQKDNRGPYFPLENYR